ncbi:hypothetical protein Sa4125_38830 [Aureimonas sp. SA4125]|uniref:iron-containing alcohol dehydrogenase n=1 Tax=Aureimonas sp. SA4125 TaxID=2826993 RepID=UPI001CC42F45|nr:iron-containing alcohol dehydrogenase [Aureimonas sp. SA4125]BDA86341.1 hypothetical protein Sa4125_38830 [Aureimonas sp. SA4125]
MSFTASAVPEIVFGPGSLREVGVRAASLDPSKRALIVADAFLVESGVAAALAANLASSGIEAEIYGDIAGEPKASHLQAAGNAARDHGAGLVIGLGGGSALDVAKIAACLAVGIVDPMHYALAQNPLPAVPLRKILIPTTAGTGSETSSTSVFSDAEGRKVWIWGPETKADLALLDPALTVTLPPALTAACGIDAFVHAFEAATNRKTHRGAELYAHQAMRLVAGSLARAVAAPNDLEARGNLLLGSCYAGVAIDYCGTAVAHMISHAMASLAPVNHGFATALAFEATLPWLVETPTAEMEAAAHACGLAEAAELPGFVSALMSECGMVRRLPPVFDRIGTAALAEAMRAPGQAPMRHATARAVTDADTEKFAAALLRLAEEKAA